MEIILLTIIKNDTVTKLSGGDHKCRVARLGPSDHQYSRHRDTPVPTPVSGRMRDRWSVVFYPVNNHHHTVLCSWGTFIFHNFSLPLQISPSYFGTGYTQWARHGGEVWTLCNMSMSNVPDSHNVPIFTVSRVSQTKTTEYLRCFSPSIIILTFHIVTDNLNLSSRIQGDWTCKVQQTSRLTTLALAPVPASCIFHWISTFLSVDGWRPLQRSWSLSCLSEHFTSHPVQL